MADEIIARPNPLLLATGVEGLLEIGGSVTIEGQAQGLYPPEYDISPNLSIALGEGSGTITKNSGGAGNAGMTSTRRVPREQPFFVGGFWEPLQATPRNQLLGVIDNVGRPTYLAPYRYPPEPEARFRVFASGNEINAPYMVGAGNDGYAVASDGVNITMLRHFNGFYNTIYQFPIPADVIDYRFVFDIYEQGGKWNFAHTRIDTKVIVLNTNNTIVRHLDTPPLCEIRAVNANFFGVTAPNVGRFQIEPYYERNDLGTIVDVEVDPLYIKPKGNVCGGTVVEGEIVQFVSNGGDGGIFEATGGTILSGLRWQAPSVEGTVNFTYTIGAVSATCSLVVQKRLSVIGVDEDGYYADMAQGERVQFIATCPSATFSSLSHPSLINSRGILVAPVDAKDHVFGEKLVTVQVYGCGQNYEFKVRIQPMYPTPAFCGRIPIKWLAKERDYLENTLVMTGGTSQVKNRNKEGIQLWDVEYDVMPQDVLSECSCEKVDGVSSCETTLATASRLDAFYTQVKLTNYFTVIDYHTKMQYKYVRLTKFEKNHGLYKTEQARRISLRWEGDLDFGTDTADCLPIVINPDCPPAVTQTNWSVIEW